MKLKQKPEDFIVEELNDYTLVPNGAFNLYLLKKQSIDSLNLFQELSRINGVPLKEISFAGIKDKHGITSQYLTTPKCFPLKEANQSNYSIKLIGRINEPIARGNLSGNKFIITIRDLDMQDVIYAKDNISNVLNFGVPNYFDSQRFGSYVENRFLITYILKGDFESAIKLYLTGVSPNDSSALKNYKRILKQKWNNLDSFEPKNPFGRQVIKEYKNTSSWVEAYKKIPAMQKELFVSAYQSFIWNESVKLLLKQKITTNNLFNITYKAGNLSFYSKLPNEDKLFLSKEFPLISPIPPKDSFQKKIIDKILEKQDLSYSNFDIKTITNNYFKEYLRDIILFPKNLSLSLPKEDELNSRKSKKYKLTISFILPKGSYATVIIKRLFGS